MQTILLGFIYSLLVVLHLCLGAQSVVLLIDEGDKQGYNVRYSWWTYILAFTIMPPILIICYPFGIVIGLIKAHRRKTQLKNEAEKKMDEYLNSDWIDMDY